MEPAWLGLRRTPCCALLRWRDPPGAEAASAAIDLCCCGSCCFRQCLNGRIIALQLIQHLPGSLHNIGWNACQAGRFDPVTAAGSSSADAMQEDEILTGFFNKHLEVGNVGHLFAEVIELVVVGRKDSATDKFAGQMLTHGPGDREAVKGGGASADLIEKHQ